MAKLLFKLTQVPDDEAQEIRELLTRENIAFYETEAGFFRVGLDAIWLTDATEEPRARALLGVYQAERQKREQENFAHLVETGQAPSAWQRFLAHPLRFIALLLAIVFVAGLTLLPFVMPALQQ